MRLEISGKDVIELPREDYEWRKINDWYMKKLIGFANDLGLKGKKIKEIIAIREKFSDKLYFDFVCEINPTTKAEGEN